MTQHRTKIQSHGVATSPLVRTVAPRSSGTKYSTYDMAINLQALLVLFVICVAGVFSSSAQSANVPNFEQAVDFNVKEQNVAEFLNALFQQIDVPISVNTNLEGNVNGKFRDTARNVFKEISNAFSVEVYYDGAVVQAYKKNEITRRLVPVTTSEAKRVVSIVSKMGLPDPLNTINREDSGLLVTGFQKFQSQIDEIITSVQASPVVVAKKRTKPAPVVQSSVSFPEESPLVYQVFKLKHAWATDTNFPVGGSTIVVPGVATILNELIQQDDDIGELLAEDNSSNSLSGLKGKGLSRQKNNKQTDSSSSSTDKRQNPGPRIVADSRLNAIVIRDNENKMAAYQNLIDSLDTESSMVEIEATIIDINTDKTRDLGVNWRYQNGLTDVLFGSGSAADQALIPGNGPITPQGQGGILSFSLGESARFLSRVRALEQQGAARIISKPHVITLSDVEAVLAATTEFFVRVAGDQEVDLFNVPVGTTLRVTPHVFEDGGVNRIKLLVNIEDGSQTSSTPVDNIPVIERANISTQAVVNEGDSLLVGGLVRESYRDARYQVPLLGRIPIVGGLFRSKTNQATRVERLFMITPRLAGGIGFGGGANSSVLAGEQNQIVRDASKRIEATNIPYRPAISYWSEQSRDEQATQSSSQTTAARYEPGYESGQLLSEQTLITEQTDQNQAESFSDAGSYAIIEGNTFKTPFKVEVWAVGQ